MRNQFLCAALTLSTLALLPRTTLAQSATPQSAAAPSQAIAFTLTNHSVIVGTITSEDAATIVVNAGPAGTITLKRADILSQGVPAVMATAIPQGPPSPPPTPGLGGFARPGKMFWVRSLSVGGSYNSTPFVQGSVAPGAPALTGKALGLQGRQTAIQTQFSFVRGSNLRALAIDASLTRATVDPIGVVANTPKVSVDFNFRQRDGQRYFMLTRYAWYRDTVRHIDYSHQFAAGIGLLAVDQPKFKLGVVPVLGLVRENKGVAEFDDRWLFGFGGIQRAILTPNPYMQIEERLVYQQAFNDSRFRTLESTVSLKGQLTKMLGVMVNFTHKYDNVLSLASTVVPIPGVGNVVIFPNSRSQIMLTGGLQISF